MISRLREALAKEKVSSDHEREESSGVGEEKVRAESPRVGEEQVNSGDARAESPRVGEESERKSEADAGGRENEDVNVLTRVDDELGLMVSYMCTSLNLMVLIFDFGSASF